MDTNIIPLPSAAVRERIRVLRDSLIDCDVVVDDKRRTLEIIEQRGDDEGFPMAVQALDEAVALRGRVACDLAGLLSTVLGVDVEAQSDERGL